MSWNAKHALLLLFSTAVTYLTGLFLGRCRKTAWRGVKKLVFAGCLAANLGVLFFFKYFNFFFESLRKLLLTAGIEPSVPVFDAIPRQILPTKGKKPAADKSRRFFKALRSLTFFSRLQPLLLQMLDLLVSFGTPYFISFVT